ncbi:MAG: MBL fold metallo-hydrolase [Bacteroidales bacterium]|nr:MBL fold metallo-hydrolase [Bacteroidales bacterium]
MEEIKSFIFNDFGVNAYIIYDETNEAVIIDGAVNSDREMLSLKQFVDNNSLKIKYIINTHGHLDHICGNDRLRKEYNVPVLANFKDNDLVANVDSEAAMFGFRMNQQSLPDLNIVDGDEIRFGNSVLKVLEVPGHSQGSVALYSETVNFVVCGDALFCGSIGRTDLPGGSHAQLIDSIRKKLFTLDRNCKALPGHGESTTIGYEIDTNPFF